MADIEAELLQVLKSFTGAVVSQSILQLSIRMAAVDIHNLNADSSQRLADCIRQGIDTFIVEPQKRDSCVSKVWQILQSSARHYPTASRPDEVTIVEESDILRARSIGHGLIRALGFSATEQTKIVTVISELARNIFKYAGTGTITITKVTGNRRGVEIVAHDSGPGIEGVEKIMAGQYRSTSGLGIGLSGSRKLMDEFSIRTARKRNHCHREKVSELIAVEIAQRPKVNETVCGDVVTVTTKPSGVLIAVADGLGHGEFAYEAARTFCDFATKHAENGIESIISDARTVMAKTRGAAAALVDLNEDQRVLEFVGIGNIELRSWSKEKIAPVSIPGIVGTALRRIRSFRYNLNDDDLFIIFSDGISSRFVLEEYRELTGRAVADRILGEFGKSHDDATCVVVRIDGFRSSSSQPVKRPSELM